MEQTFDMRGRPVLTGKGKLEDMLKCTGDKVARACLKCLCKYPCGDKMTEHDYNSNHGHSSTIPRCFESREHLLVFCFLHCTAHNKHLLAVWWEEKFLGENGSSAGDTAQWWSACLAQAGPWVKTPGKETTATSGSIWLASPLMGTQVIN